MTADEVAAANTEGGVEGERVDPTPDENYTVAGVTAGAATPETDEDAAKAAAEAVNAEKPKQEEG